MNIAIFHREDAEYEGWVKVAEIEKEFSHDLEALEFAFRWTQNINGSWSRPELDDNPDAHPAVKVIGKLPVVDGKTYGLRSSMVGDVFEVDGVSHVVMPFGFKQK